MRPSILLTLLVTAATLGGCLDDQPVQEAQSPFSAGGGSPDTHGEPTVEEGEVDVQMMVLQWVATQDIVISNDFGGATLGSVEVASENGDIHVMPSTDGNYRVVLTLSSWGSTPDEAEDNLEAIEIEHSDELEGERLRLATSGKPGEVDAPLPIMGVRRGHVDITYYLPAGPGYDVRATGANGDISIVDLEGTAFSAETSNGDVQLLGLTTDALSATTANGDVVVEAMAERVAAASASGDVVARLVAREMGNYALATGNGDVVLGVNGSDEYGYDVSASTSNGDIIVDLEDVDDVEPAADGHRHVRSTEFDERPIQVQAELASSNGSIMVTDDDVTSEEAHH